MIDIGPDRRESPARILIIDDEPHARRLLEVMLAPEGFTIATACDSEDGLARIALEAPDLIIIDIVMPGMDGCATTAMIKKNPATRHIPVIMVTAMDDRNARMLGLGAGAEDFLTKPVDRGELCVRVRNLLRLKAYGEHYDKYSQILESEVVARTSDLIERTRTLEQNAVALRRSEERTSYALGGARMGVWEADLVTGENTWSASMAQIYGRPAGYVPASADAFFELVHEPDREALHQQIARTAAGNAEGEVEFRVTWPDGSLHWIAGRACLVRDERGAPARMLGVAADINEKKTLEAQFRQAQKMEAVGQLAGGVAHDFNNLLTAILGFSDFVMQTMSVDDPRRGDMEEVIKAGKRATKLTGQLLAFSRQQMMQTSAIDLNALVSGMRPMLARLLGEQLDVVEMLAPDLGLVRADAGQIEQVLMNLVINARDAMPSGGRLAIQTQNVDLDGTFLKGDKIVPGRYVLLAVSDSGMGMDEVTQQKLFEPFFTTKEHGKGTGLGLSTVYGIVKQSGGHIWVYSEPGKGATFKIYLPHINRPDEVTVVTTPEKVLKVGNERILLVEDDEAVRFLTCRILEQGGYQVTDAANPAKAEALFRARSQDFDLLVSDVVMPGCTGFALFNKLVGLAPRLRVLYMSGFTDDSLAHQGNDNPGIEFFLQKPFTASALNQRVREVLDR